MLLDGKPVQQDQWLPLSADEKDMDGKGQIYVGGKVDLDGLKPGVYELIVSVKDARSKKSHSAPQLLASSRNGAMQSPGTNSPKSPSI